MVKMLVLGVPIVGFFLSQWLILEVFHIPGVLLSGILVLAGVPILVIVLLPVLLPEVLMSRVLL